MKQVNKQGLGLYPRFLSGAFWRGSLHPRGGACSRGGPCWHASDSARQKRKGGGELELQGARGSTAVLTTPTHSQVSRPLGIQIHHWRRKGGRAQVRSICTSQSFHSQSFHRALHPAEMSCGLKPAISRRNSPPWPLSKPCCLQVLQDTAGIRQ